MRNIPVKPAKIVLRKVSMRLKAPFTTSFGTMQDKMFCLVEVVDENGHVGWGESVADDTPAYSEETTETNWHMLEDFLIPRLLGKEIDHPDRVSEWFQDIRKNNMAKATLETAVWDLYAKNNEMTLREALGGQKSEIEVGVSIGIQPDVGTLLNIIEEKLEMGYKKIKVKIKPGKDVHVLREIRKAFPDIPLMADANSAYTLEDVEHLQKLDEFNLMMIEQPLNHDDIVDHAVLQKRVETPICLDESIVSADAARKAIELGSCRIINIKLGRVGGLTESKKIHDLCEKHDIPVWCGGMLEAGVGRAHNIALTTLPNFTLPGDTAPSSHYWVEDIISPEVTMDHGVVKVPDGPGIGFDVNRETLERYTTRIKVFD
ncbi:MAG: o-succinylbenzoate synthase [Novibacillus thermophilus]|jgi:O-succinylbenzoate synthase|uniref:o-succinylbenzoate synthase n=1 Tax=Novibacillus thermophilus TaxID=1471761 RepID=A0A1U9K7H5_9BACL|nr:o-succinylbenzoate synthase [Novibacillus thermophilus]AQS56015.1 o-succinylbenzoate synthase [Novibacillus thermophilus]